MMLYDINDKPSTIKEWFLYGLQQTLAILTATVLISTICGTSISAGLVAGGISTLMFLCITKFKAPVFISNSGATASAVIGTLGLAGPVEQNFTGVVLGGLTILIIYTIASLMVKHFGVAWIEKLLPPIVSGTTILVIGCNLAGFIPTYVQVSGAYSLIGVALAFTTMIITALCLRYGKGIFSTIPFLIGLLGGYLIAVILTLCNIAPLVDFSVFTNLSLVNIPDFAFMHINFTTFDWSTLPLIIIMFGCVSLAALTEHVGDMISASSIVGHNLLEEPGLHRTLLGDGIGSFIGTMIGAQPNTTYSESLSTIAVSRVASTWIIFVAAIFTAILGFIGPINTLFTSIPGAVFGGISMVAYGYIALSGLRNLVNLQNLNTKNSIIFAVMLTVGVSGITISFGNFALSGVALSMLSGVVLNLLLTD